MAVRWGFSVEVLVKNGLPLLNDVVILDNHKNKRGDIDICFKCLGRNVTLDFCAYCDSYSCELSQLAHKCLNDYERDLYE